MQVLPALIRREDRRFSKEFTIERFDAGPPHKLARGETFHEVAYISSAGVLTHECKSRTNGAQVLRGRDPQRGDEAYPTVRCYAGQVPHNTQCVQGPVNFLVRFHIINAEGAYIQPFPCR